VGKGGPAKNILGALKKSAWVIELIIGFKTTVFEY
jgi:hypothetical protein